MSQFSCRRRQIVHKLSLARFSFHSIRKNYSIRKNKIKHCFIDLDMDNFQNVALEKHNKLRLLHSKTALLQLDPELSAEASVSPERNLKYSKLGIIKGYFKV